MVGFVLWVLTCKSRGQLVAVAGWELLPFPVILRHDSCTLCPSTPPLPQTHTHTLGDAASTSPQPPPCLPRPLSLLFPSPYPLPRTHPFLFPDPYALPRTHPFLFPQPLPSPMCQPFPEPLPFLPYPTLSFTLTPTPTLPTTPAPCRALLCHVDRNA